MVLVVNEELKLGKGKTGAQCAHAAVGAVERLHELRQGVLLRQWELCGQPKICLRAASTLVGSRACSVATGVRRVCRTRHPTACPATIAPALSLLQELRQLAAAASGHGLPTYVVQDAG